MIGLSKTCSGCGQTKGAGEFYAHPRTADRLHHVCKDCQRRRTKANRLNNPAVQARDRLRAKARKRPSRAALPLDQKRRAQVAASNAIRDGRLIKQPCVNCGSKNRVHGHHEDYSKPLEVVWLCARCHGRLHAGHKIETRGIADAQR